jgi:anthranilate synthase component 1
MQSPFDIAADLDTPVSAYIKLKGFKPRFLLESVEGGERLARYSFLGFGEAVTLSIDSREALLDGVAQPLPRDVTEWLQLMRRTLAMSPDLQPAIDDIPFCGGLVGATGYDVVRYFEKLPPTI